MGRAGGNGGRGGGLDHYATPNIPKKLSHECGPLHFHLSLFPPASINIPGHFLYTPGIFGSGFLFPVDFWFCPGAIPDRIRAQFYNLVRGGGVGGGGEGIL